MGLHLNYELRLPDTRSADDVDRILAAMYEHAKTLPFDELSNVAYAKRNGEETEPWLEFWASLVARPYSEDIPPSIGDPETARGFLVNAGEGCETATFGFMLRGDEAGSQREWFWVGMCKTQYASTVSDAHLVKCHTSLVSILDNAMALGVDVTVHDETFYWDTRDEERLIYEVGGMNRIVAALAGKLSDAIGAEHDIKAPIFEHPRFERLEMGESS